MNLFFISMIFSMTIIFLFLTHPLSLGFILLIQTILIAFTSGQISMNYWYSYIIFLIMIGGLLILFMYMTSTASNEKFKFSFKLMNLFLMINLTLLLFLFFDIFFWNFNLINDLINQNSLISFKLSLNKFLNYPMNLNQILIMIYLLITLIMTVKITNIQYGPLRQKM